MHVSECSAALDATSCAMQMGPSGSGKSTLLGRSAAAFLPSCPLSSCQSLYDHHNTLLFARTWGRLLRVLPRLRLSCHADVLAGRKTAGELTGTVLVGGKPPSRKFMRRYTGYVEQFGKTLHLDCSGSCTYSASAFCDLHVCIDVQRPRATHACLKLFAAAAAR